MYKDFRWTVPGDRVVINNIRVIVTRGTCDQCLYGNCDRMECHRCRCTFADLIRDVHKIFRRMQ